jgi:ectoine hydroxylase-related dioxygenase (phytanoyl-CoA dioxygenase family)
MVTLRLHLDDCDKSNGALKVLPGSHRSGKLSAGKIEDCRSASTENLCTANAGDALFMRPLLLHASSPAEKPRHRRVVHIEFAMDELPGGLEWAERA